MELLFLEHHASHLHSGQTGLSVPKGWAATAEANTTSEKEVMCFLSQYLSWLRPGHALGGAGGVNMQKNREEPVGVYLVDHQQVQEMCLP